MFAEIDWITAIKEVGFPIVSAVAAATALGYIGYGAWKVVVWVGLEFLVPIRNEMTGFLSSLRGNVEKMGENLDAQTTSLQDINAKQSRIEHAMTRLVEHGCGHCQNGVAGKTQ